ncbi:hypothetical protein K2W90_00130 [Candidatus Babeliales bacterium]|nr:hypothetical protein [Candidatus Babeliales bacterium]
MKKLLLVVVVCFFVVSKVQGAALAYIKMMKSSGYSGKPTHVVQDYKNSSVFRILEQEIARMQREKWYKESQEWYQKTSVYWLKKLFDWYLSFCCHPFPKERTEAFCQILVSLCKKGVVCDVVLDDGWTPFGRFR